MPRTTVDVKKDSQKNFDFDYFDILKVPSEGIVNLVWFHDVNWLE